MQESPSVDPQRISRVPLRRDYDFVYDKKELTKDDLRELGRAFTPPLYNTRAQLLSAFKGEREAWVIAFRPELGEKHISGTQDVTSKASADTVHMSGSQNDTVRIKHLSDPELQLPNISRIVGAITWFIQNNFVQIQGCERSVYPVDMATLTGLRIGQVSSPYVTKSALLQAWQQDALDNGCAGAVVPIPKSLEQLYFYRDHGFGRAEILGKDWSKQVLYHSLNQYLGADYQDTDAVRRDAQRRSQ